MWERDVSIESRRSGEINRHFASDGHWERDVSYRVHKGLPVYNQLRQALPSLMPNWLITVVFP